MKTRINSSFVVILVLISCPAILQAQDPFEIQVFEYETARKGMWNLETHLNYVGSGTRTFDGRAAHKQPVSLHLWIDTRPHKSF